MEVSTGNCHW